MAFLFKNHMEEALKTRAEALELEVAAANATIQELEGQLTILETSKKKVRTYLRTKKENAATRNIFED